METYAYKDHLITRTNNNDHKNTMVENNLVKSDSNKPIMAYERDSMPVVAKDSHQSVQQPSALSNDLQDTKKLSTNSSDLIELTVDDKIWSIKASRIIYYMEQFPLVILLLIGAWTLIGYHVFVGMPETSNSSDSSKSEYGRDYKVGLSAFEYATAIGACITAFAAIVGALYDVGRKKVNSVNTLIGQCILRLIFAIICFILAAATISCAIFVIQDIVPIAQNATILLRCFTSSSRLLLNSCILFIALIIFICSLLLIVFNILALKELYRRRRAYFRIRVSKSANFDDIGIRDTPADRY